MHKSTPRGRFFLPLLLSVGFSIALVTALPRQAMAFEEEISASDTQAIAPETTETKNLEPNTVVDINSEYEKIPVLDTVTEIPSSAWTTLKESFGPGTLWPWIGIITSTALLYKYDEELLLEAQRFGRRIGLGNEDNTKSYIKIDDISLFRGPSDIGSLMYFLGDGWMHVGIALGFGFYGHYSNNNRAYNTGLQIVHGMFVSTIFSQAVKRATGRESPFVRTEPRGKFHPFPSIAEYQQQTSRRDAFPSGHVMTAALTFTVILENYPEYAYWVRPTQYVWLSLLMFQMMNNGVHWASDYPLGIAMGYMTGKVVARMGRKSANSAEKNFFILPVASGDVVGAQMTYRF